MLACFIVYEFFLLLTFGYSIWIGNAFMVITELVMVLGLGLLYFQCKKEKEENLFLIMLGMLLMINAILIFVFLGGPQISYKKSIMPIFFFFLGAEKFSTGAHERIHSLKISKKLLGE